MLSDKEALQILQSKIKEIPDTVIVLGSGWNKVLNSVQIETEISYEDLFSVRATAPGHAGKLVVAAVGGNRVAFMAGRFHMYEGYSAREATTHIRVFAKAGMKKLILTAAVGALNEKYQVGDFVVTSDLLTLFLSPDNPLVGPEFIDMSACLDEEMRQKALQACAAQNIPFHEGVYAYCHGPSFETPADKMALRFLGADVVGMSTVPETIQARALGVDVLSLAFITNLAFVKHDHQEVLANAEKAGGRMSTLLGTLIENFQTQR
jgi:purine-nucleoside phosphorylase